MPDNVSNEEVEALVGQDPSPSPAAVAVRDFRQPRRLSASQQQSLGTAISQALPAMEGDLAIWLRGECTLSMSGVGEATAVGLFDDFTDPISILTFEVDGAQGWIVWDTASALRSSIIALGSEVPEDLEERVLSPMEQGLMTDMLGVLTKHLGDLLGLELVTTNYTQTVRDFLTQHDAGSEMDLQRLYVHLDLESSAGATTLKFYLPGILPEANDPPEPVAQLPRHLDLVSVELSAELTSVDVSLPDLMEIEVGDVIPLDIPVGSDLLIRVEGDVAGTATWGQHNGITSILLKELNALRK